MSKKYKNKYRSTSHRMLNWDYSGNGMYFITLVTQHRECNLGKIIINTNGRACLQLSDYGRIINDEWNKSFKIRNELFCDEYIIMPNHLHAIVVLKKPILNLNGSHDSMDTNGLVDSRDSHVDTDGLNADTDGLNADTHGLHVDTDGLHVDTHGRAYLRQPSQQSSKFIRLPKSISSFIGGFKSAINSKIDDYIDQNNLNISKYNRNNHFFQPNYHDHIIRNNAEYHRIKNYIINNPKNWIDDKLNNPKNTNPDN